MKPPPTVLHTCFQCLNKIAEIKWLFLWWVPFVTGFLTVRACRASHSCGEWILCTSRVTAIWGLEKKKDKRYIYLAQPARQIGPISKRYPSSSLLIWSQKPMMYSQSSCLFVGWVALSDTETHEWLIYAAQPAKWTIFISSQPKCDF